jgi:hypothetical protein
VGTQEGERGGAGSGRDSRQVKEFAWQEGREGGGWQECQFALKVLQKTGV